MKYIEYLRRHFNDPKSPVMTLREMKTTLKLKGIKLSYLKRLINYLIKKNEIIRITKGVYTFHDEITVVGFAFRPFYYGIENALTIKGLWEQGTTPIVITPRNVRQGVRKFGTGNYSIFKIKKQFFFGFELIKYYDFWIPVSDYEKTLIDLIYYKRHIRDDVLKELKKKIDRKKLMEYLKVYPTDIKNKVILELKN